MKLRKFIFLGLIFALSFFMLGTHAQKNTEDESLPIEDVQRFTTAISQIKNFYVEDVEDKELFEDAIRGMLAGLDPHSSYLDEDEYKDLQATTTGKFGGLGIEVTMEDGYVKVISPIDDTPAYKAGVKAGDLIVRINDNPVKGMNLREAVKQMRGKKGTAIKLTVLRKNEKAPLKFKIIRAIIVLQSVKSYMLDEGLGYLRISHFQAPTANDVLKAIAQLNKDSKNSIHGLVIDLRNNPGGLLDAAIDVSDIFIHNDRRGKEELIVYTKGRLPGSEFIAKASPGDIIKNIPIVVLINEGSASGSEIVAGALQDHNRAILMGKTTFGKGSVQTILPLDGKRGLKLTTALYYTPSGRSIQAKGITPDIIIEDLKIEKTDEDSEDEAWYKLKEADLKGHLANGNKKKGKKAKKVEIKTPTASDDYQLYEAYNLLKSISILKTKS